MTDDRKPGSSDVGAEAELQQRARRAFADQALSPDVTKRLDAARRQAVAAVPEPRAELFSSPAAGWMSGVAVAATVVLSLAVLLPGRGDVDQPFAPEVSLDAFTEAMLSADDLELIEELEFYAWLDELEAPDHG